MDNRFIFLYQLVAKGPCESTVKEARLRLEVGRAWGWSPRRSLWGVGAISYLRGDRKLAGKPKGDSTEPEEPRRGLVERLVDRTADRHRWAGGGPLRRTGDPSLRNSAN